MESTEMFAILPYLKTSRPVSIRGICFRSSNDLEGLTTESKNHLKALCPMFFLQNDLRIVEMTYACLPLTDDKEENETLFRRLREAQILIGYLYSTPHPSFGDPFLRLEHSSLYLFRPGLVSRFLVWPEHGVINLSKETLPQPTHPGNDLPGYEGLLNWHSYLWVVEGHSRIYPQTSHFWLNISQDLWPDFEMFLSHDHNWAVGDLITSKTSEATELQNRIFTALEWYNRSAASDINEGIALVYLAIAFESLLQLCEGEKLTERFKETVMALLGPAPRLDSWLDQFYKARSKIVHEGNWSHLMFYPVDRKRFAEILKAPIANKESVTPYRSLTAYGRQIFRLCLTTILSGAKVAERARLSSLFVHSQERLEKICARLAQTDDKPGKRLASVSRDILDLHEYWLESEEYINLETLAAAGRLVIQCYLDTNPRLPEEAMNLMRAAISHDSSFSIDDKLERLRELAEHLRKWKKATPGQGTVEPSDPFHIVWLFVEYAAKPGFVLRSRYGYKP